jgi:hypothetical protein
MSTSWTIMSDRGLTYTEISAKTPIRMKYSDSGRLMLVLDGNVVHTYVQSVDDPIDGFTRYGDNDVIPFLKWLVRAFDVHIVSEYFLREYLESNQEIPNYILHKYRSSIIDMILEDDELLKYAPDNNIVNDFIDFNNDDIF